MKFEFDHKTGTMQPKKNEEIYFAQSQGGGLIVDDKKHNIKYIIERDESITKLFGNFDKDNLNLYDMRDARIISDRVIRLLGRDHKYSDFHYFLRGYHMNENFVQKMSDFLDESVWGNMLDRSMGDSERKEDEITYDSLTYDDCTMKQLYQYLIKNYNVIGDNKIDYEEKTLRLLGNDMLSCKITIPITSSEQITVVDDEEEIPHALYCTPSLMDYIKNPKMMDWNCGADDEEDVLVKSCNNGDDEMYCFEVVDYIDELLKNVPNPILKKRESIKESIWGGMLDRSVGDTLRKEDEVTYSTLEDDDCTIEMLYNYLIQNYKPLGDEQISLNSGKYKGTDWHEVHIPITLDGENIETELDNDDCTKIWSIDFTLNLMKYVEEMNTVEEIDDENINSDTYARAYTGSSPLLCSGVVDFLDEILTLVPNPALKKKDINIKK